MGWTVTVRPEVKWVATCSERTWDGTDNAAGVPCDWHRESWDQADVEAWAGEHRQAHARRYQAYQRALEDGTPWPPPAGLARLGPLAPGSPGT